MTSIKHRNLYKDKHLLSVIAVCLLTAFLFSGFSGLYASAQASPTSDPQPQRDGTDALREQFLTVGSIVQYGSYEQDNDLDNGAEPIEWYVWEVYEGKNQCLLIAKYCLDTHPFNDTEKSVLWRDCTLRKWLNKEFLNTAFSKKEQSAIVTTTLTNDYGKGSDTYKTKDKIFLPEWGHVCNWSHPMSKYVEAVITPYAKAQGAYESGYTFGIGRYGAGRYWLRSAYETHIVARVAVDRSSGDEYAFVNADTICIRPAMVVDIGKLVFD